MEESSWSRLVGVLTSPTKTFESIARRPTVLVPLVVLLALGLGVLMLALQKVDMAEMTRQQIADSGRELTAEQIDQAVAINEKFGWVFFIAAVLVFGPLAYLLIAGVMLVTLRLIGGEINYKTSLSTTLHGLMPSAAAAVLALPVVLAREEISGEELQGGSLLASHLGVLAGEDASKWLVSLLQSIDVFSFWGIALFAIGYAITARVSRGSAAAVVIGWWAVYVAAKVGLTALFAG